MAYKFTKFKSSWLQRVGTIATEGAQNTHNWSGRTETATKNGVGPAGSCHHCGSHSSVASSIAPDDVLDIFSCKVYHTLLWTGFKFDEFGGNSWSGINSRVYFCNNSLVARMQWTFHVSQSSIETSFRWDEKRYIILQQICSGNQLQNLIRISRVFLEILQKPFWSHFSEHRVFVYICKSSALAMHILDFRCFVSKLERFKSNSGRKSRLNLAFIDPM